MSKVLLVDDHKVFLQALGGQLQSGDFPNLITTHDGELVIGLIESNKPDLVVLDIDLGEVSGLKLARTIKTRWPRIRVIMLTMHTKRAFVKEALDIGVESYLPKNIEMEELADTMKLVLRGQIYFPQEVIDLVRGNSLNPFTELEIKVLQLMDKGYTTKEIAAAMYISTSGVYFHKGKIQDKTGETSIHKQVAYAKKLGII